MINFHVEYHENHPLMNSNPPKQYEKSVMDRLNMVFFYIDQNYTEDIPLEKAAEIQPDVILCVGQAGGRSAVTPERIGVNIRDAKIPDNSGNQPIGEFVAEDGPAAYFSTLPVREIGNGMAEIVKTAMIKDRDFAGKLAETAALPAEEPSSIAFA